MNTPQIIEQLLALSDPAAQAQLLAKQTSRLTDELAQALKQEADSLLRADVQRSLQVAELILEASRLTGSSSQRALGLLAQANACAIGLGEYQRAVDLYEEAEQLYQQRGLVLHRARAVVGKLYALSNLGRYEQAMEAGHWAGAILRSHEEWRTLATLTMNLAIARGRMGEDANALDLFDEASQLYRRLGPEGDPYRPWIEQNRGIVLRNLGRFKASEEACQQAWEMLSRAGQPIEAARARQNLATTYYALGRYNEALELLEEVRDVFLGDGRQRDAILVELFVSNCLLQLRRFGDVLEKCLAVRQQFTERGTTLEVAQAILNEAVAFAGLNRHAEALQSLREARRLFEGEGNRVLVACTDLETAAMLLQQRRFTEALDVAQACTGTFQAYGLPVEEARARLFAARAATALRQLADARTWTEQVLFVAQDKDLPSLAYQSHYLLGTLDQLQQKVEAALDHYDEAARQLERLRGRLMVEYRADFLEDKQRVYEDLVDLSLQLDQPVRGLEYAQRAKSRALLDMLAYRLDLSITARSPGDEPLVERLTALRSQRDRLYRRWETHDEMRLRGQAHTGTDQQQVQQEVLALENQITQLWHRLLIRNADYAKDADLWQVRAEPVQPFLDPGTTLLKYFVVHGQLVAFLIDAKGTQARRLDTNLGTVQGLMRLFLLNLRAVPMSDPTLLAELSANATGLLHRLHTALIAPLSDCLADSQALIVVPHGPLHYLPFHALHDGDSFLLERYEVSYLPGASLLRYRHQPRPAADGLLTLGHSYGGRLPFAVEEATRVAQRFGGQAFVEDQATTKLLRNAAAHRRVLHLAAHGDFRPDNPLFSGIALADGWLTTLDIFNLRLAASLITLSACQTGRNVVAGGDELLGLMRAFLYAGAATLVLTLWPVEDRSTAHLMERFYEKLAIGWTKGAALRHAQSQLAHNADAYAHPYFWAPFFLVGDTGLL